jgi:hypothetical protein
MCASELNLKGCRAHTVDKSMGKKQVRVGSRGLRGRASPCLGPNSDAQSYSHAAARRYALRYGTPGSSWDARPLGTGYRQPSAVSRMQESFCRPGGSLNGCVCLWVCLCPLQQYIQQYGGKSYVHASAVGLKLYRMGGWDMVCIRVDLWACGRSAVDRY